MLFVISMQIWSGIKLWGGPDFDTAEDGDLDAPGNKIAIIVQTGSYKVASNSYGDMYVLVSNPYGTPIWSRLIGRIGRNEWPYGMVYDNMNNITVVGTSCTPYCDLWGCNSYYCNTDEPRDAFIIKLDINTGNVVASKHLYGINGWNSTTIYGINKTNDGGFVVAGSVWHGDQWGNRDAFVAKLDANLNLQWSKVVGTSTNDWYTTAFQTQDGNIMAVGQSPYDIILAKFNINDGSIIWKKAYFRWATHIGVGTTYSWATQTSDGSIIIPEQVSGGHESNMMFIKLDANGNYVCGRVIGMNNHYYYIDTLGFDAGVRAAEGQYYYYATGFWDGGNASMRSASVYSFFMYARFNKTDCDLVDGKIRYIIKTNIAYEQYGRKIKVRPNSGIPYVIGSIERPGWSNGNSLDATIAADSGLQDTCYWRSLTPDINYPITLSSDDASAGDDLGSQIGISNSTDYLSSSILVNSNFACGLLTPLSTDEKYEDCHISLSKDGRLFKLISKDKQDIDIRVYSVDGRIVYSKSLRQFEGSIDGRLNLSSGVYIAKVSYGERTIQKKFIIK